MTNDYDYLTDGSLRKTHTLYLVPEVLTCRRNVVRMLGSGQHLKVTR
jgi:hypothetical protein